MKRGQVGGAHYEKMPVDPWAVIETWPAEQRIGYFRGNVLKYTMRMGSKGDAKEDAKKAAHYLSELIKIL